MIVTWVRITGLRKRLGALAYWEELRGEREWTM
jgi:hypothetical protein